MVVAASFIAADAGQCAARGTISVAEASKGVQVGDQLEAIVDVELDEALIRKGSKVSVSRRSVAGGRVLLDVALADGHVVRAVPLAEIMKTFRRVSG